MTQHRRSDWHARQMELLAEDGVTYNGRQLYSRLFVYD